MTENNLTVFQGGQVSKHDDSTFNDLAKSGDFLLRVQLFGSNSKIVKAGKFPQAHYGIVRSKENIEDLGAVFDCVPIAWRPKAMRIDGDDVLVYYDPGSKDADGNFVPNADFTKVVEESEEKDSGCMYGPEFLIWLSPQKLFATLFFNSKTMRRESPNMKALLGRPATLKVQFIETKKYSWHGPIVIPCTTAPTNVPDAEESQKVIEKFNNPPANEVEKADEESRER